MWFLSFAILCWSIGLPLWFCEEMVKVALGYEDDGYSCGALFIEGISAY